MKNQHLFTLVLLFISYCAYSQPEDGPDPDSISVTIDQQFLKVTLFQEESVAQAVVIDNAGTESVLSSMSLVNTSHETTSETTFLNPPLLFRGADKIVAWDPVTATKIRSRFARYPRSFSIYTQPTYEGIAYDGETLHFMSGPGSGIVYKIASGVDSANIADSTFIPELLDAKIGGLGHSGKFLYASNIVNNTIYKIDFDSGSVVDQMSLPSVGDGLTFGGNRGTIFVSTKDRYILEVNFSTKQVINQFPTPFDRCDGLGYSNSLDVLFADFGFYETSYLNPDTGQELSREEAFGWSAAGDEFFGLKWLDLDSLSFEVGASNSVQLNLSLDAKDLAPGVYKTTVRFNLDDNQNTVIDLPVELNILPVINDLTIESFCLRPFPAEALWKIHNPNDVEVSALWRITNDPTLSDSIKLQPGENILSTSYSGGTLQLDWLNEKGEARSGSETSNGVVCEVEGLVLTSNCSDNPDIDRQWQFSNPNLFSITLDWELEGTDESGVIEATPGESFFTTSVVSPGEIQTLKIVWRDEENNIRRQRKISSGIPCDLRGLTLNAPECITDPDAPRLWEIVNPNDFFVSVDWEIQGMAVGGGYLYDGGTIFAAPGSTNFFTSLNLSNQTAKITWMDEERNIKRQRKVATDAPCMNAPSSLARSSAPIDQEINEELMLSHVFPNPFSEHLSISLGTIVGDKKEVKIIVYDMLGNRVYESTKQWQNGQADTQINTSTFAKGTYILALTFGEQVYRSKVIKE